MKTKLYLIFFTFILLFSMQIHAQLDNSSKNTKKRISKGFLANPSIKTTQKPTSLELTDNSGFRAAYKKEQKRIKEKQAETAFNNKGIITPELLRKQTLARKVEKYNTKIPMIDKDLGMFRTKSKNLIISSFDFGMFDGDIISVSINNKKIIDRYTLTHQKKTFVIPIPEGFNRVEIIAESEGELRPNTGAFTVIDDFNKIIISDLWSLAKGAKVIALVYREKNLK